MSDPETRLRELKEAQDKIIQERHTAMIRSEARAYLERKVEANHLQAKNHHLLAPLLQESGQVDEALRRLKFAVLSNPQDLKARNDLALAIFKLGRHYWQRAVNEFKMILQLDSENFLGNKNIAAVYAARGRYDEAFQHAKAAVRIDPNDVGARRNLAQIYDAIGNSREAVVQNQYAVSRGPGRHGAYDRGDAEAYRRLAVQRAGRGETKKGFAHEHYDAYRALSRKPFVLPDSERTVEILLNARQDF